MYFSDLLKLVSLTQLQKIEKERKKTDAYQAQVFSTAYLYWKYVEDEVKKFDGAYDKDEFVRYWTDYQKLSKQITQIQHKIQHDNTSRDTEANDILKSIPASFHDTYSSIFENIDMKTFENNILDIIQSRENEETIIDMLQAFLNKVSQITDLQPSKLDSAQFNLISSMNKNLMNFPDTLCQRIPTLVMDQKRWKQWRQQAWKDNLKHLLNETLEPSLDDLDDLYRDCLLRIHYEDDTPDFFLKNRAQLTHSQIKKLTRETSAKNIIDHLIGHRHSVRNPITKQYNRGPLTPELLCDILQKIEIKDTDEISLSDISRWYESQRPSSSVSLNRCEAILNLIPKIPSLSNSNPYDLQILLSTIDPAHHDLLTTYIIKGNININALKNLTKTDNEAFLSSLRLGVNAITQDDSKSHNLESLFLALSKAKSPETFEKLLTLLIPDDSQYEDTFYQKLNEFWEKRYNEQLVKNRIIFKSQNLNWNSYKKKMIHTSRNKKQDKITICNNHYTLFQRAEKNKNKKTSASNVTLGLHQTKTD